MSCYPAPLVVSICIKLTLFVVFCDLIDFQKRSLLGKSFIVQSVIVKIVNLRQMLLTILSIYMLLKSGIHG